MAYHKMSYLQPSLTKAIIEKDVWMIRYHLKEPNGAISQGYLQSCIEWAAANRNIPALRLLLTMLCSDPEPLIALQTWGSEAFQVLMDHVDKNQKRINTACFTSTLQAIMSGYFVNYDNLRIFFNSELGKQFLHTLPVPIQEKNKIFLTEMGAECMKKVAVAKEAAVAAAAAAATTITTDDEDPSSSDEETCYDRAVATGHTCINPYCSECK
jgi:hypothetical protein